MKYAAILFTLLFALTTPPVAATPDAPEEALPEYVDTAGVVTEITDDTLLLDTETHGQVLVHLTDETLYEGETPAVGAYVHVLNNGAMTMSIPPQITALRVGCYAYTGTVSEIDEGYFLLATDNDVYRVNAEDDKLAALTVGDKVTVYSNGMMTMSIPAQVYGELIVSAD